MKYLMFLLALICFVISLALNTFELLPIGTDPSIGFIIFSIFNLQGFICIIVALLIVIQENNSQINKKLDKILKKEKV